MGDKEHFENLLESLHPERLAFKVLLLSSYCLIYEQLKKFVVVNAKDFFAPDGFEKTGLNVRYKKEVLERDPLKKLNPFRGSVAWLIKLECLDESDADFLKESNDLRNLIVHELHIILARQEKFLEVEKKLERLFPKLREVSHKTRLWWINNIELPTEPNYRGHTVEDMFDITGMTTNILIHWCFGQKEEAWECYKRFKKYEEKF